MNELISYIEDFNPHKIELQVIDYQDEGIKLEMFLKDNNYDCLDISTISQGSIKELNKLMHSVGKELKTLGYKVCVYDDVEKL